MAEAALVAKRAVDPVLLDMREVTPITDYFLICHGTSNVHIRALSEAVLQQLKEAGVHPGGMEGKDAARWVLLDYGDVIVHIFAEEEREFYSLERLWGDAREVPTEGVAATARPRSEEAPLAGRPDNVGRPDPI